MRVREVRPAIVILLIGAISLGCTAPAIDCRSDSACIMQALQNDCQDAHMENIRAQPGYTLGTADLRVSVTNQKTSCRVEAVWSDAANKTLSTVEVDFRLPLEKCGSGTTASYMTVDGACKSIDIK